MGNVTGCVAMITASACGVLRWVHGKTSRPKSAPAHDFGSTPNPRNIPRTATGQDCQGARTVGRLRGAGRLPVDHRTGCGAGEDGRQSDCPEGIGILSQDRSHAENEGRGEAAQGSVIYHALRAMLAGWRGRPVLFAQTIFVGLVIGSIVESAIACCHHIGEQELAKCGMVWMLENVFVADLSEYIQNHIQILDRGIINFGPFNERDSLNVFDADSASRR